MTLSLQTIWEKRLLLKQKEDFVTMLPLDKIFICHHAPLAERKLLLEREFVKYELDVEWVEQFRPDEIFTDYERHLTGWQFHSKVFISQPYGGYANFSKKITLSELSLYLKHEYCLFQQQQKGWNNILILEDDVLLPNNFIEYLSANMQEFTNPAEFGIHLDILELGTAFGFLSRQIRPGKCIHFDPMQKTRCTHAAVFNISCTKKILDRLHPINLPIDFKLNEIMTLEKLNVAWSEPGIIQNPVFHSTIIR